jgi:hypothetical protein
MTKRRRQPVGFAAAAPELGPGSIAKILKSQRQFSHLAAQQRDALL